VEDHEDARRTLQLLLESQGHAVEAVATGDEGLARLQEGAVDVALVDLGLPGVDGYEVARRVRAAPGGDAVQLVAITGYGQPEDRRRTADAGFDDHLVKPFTLTRLSAVLGVGPRRGRAAPL
jgi:CheY-like chemotaxis protein